MDKDVLERVVAWGDPLPGFAFEHAAAALTVVQFYAAGIYVDGFGFVAGVGDGDANKLVLFAADLAWLFWLDDRFDDGDGTTFDVAEAIALAASSTHSRDPSGLSYLRATLMTSGFTGMGLGPWESTARGTMSSWQRERQMARHQRGTAYADYLADGPDSSTILHLLSTAALLYDLDLLGWLGEPVRRRLLNNLAVSCRLHNDLMSLAKERKEGVSANAVMLMERFMTPQKAREFIENELAAYERIVDHDVRRLPADDPLARLGRILPAAHRRFYTLATSAEASSIADDEILISRYHPGARGV